MDEKKLLIRMRGIVKRFYIGEPNELEILHGIAISDKTGSTYELKSDFEVLPPLRSGFFPEYLAKDHLNVDPEAALI